MRELINGAGSLVGHEQAYKDRLIRHVQDVRTHFADCWSDFMEFDVADGDGWDKLCGVLGQARATTRFSSAQHREDAGAIA